MTENTVYTWVVRKQSGQEEGRQDIAFRNSPQGFTQNFPSVVANVEPKKGYFSLVQSPHDLTGSGNTLIGTPEVCLANRLGISQPNQVDPENELSGVPNTFSFLPHFFSL